MSQGLSNNDRHTLLTLVPSVTSLTVALAGHRVTAAISVSTVTCFSTVWTPVTCITSCSRYVTFDINREKMTHLQLNPAAVTTPALHCYLSCSGVRSSRQRRYTARSPRHSEHCSRRYTSFDILDRNVRSDTLQEERKPDAGFRKLVFWGTCCIGSHPKAALNNFKESLHHHLLQRDHCLTRYYGNQAVHSADTYSSDTIFP